MSSNSKIEWTEHTWNPVRGCSIVSKGCTNCYAMRQAHRFSAPGLAYEGLTKMSNAGPVWNGNVTLLLDMLDQPLRWKHGRRIFVNSMSDLFHEQVPFEFIASVFAIMGVTTRHTYQILTKRPERMLEFFEWAHSEYGPNDFGADEKIFDHWPKHIPWDGYDNCGPGYPYKNVWLGVSVEDQTTADSRLRLLRRVPAAVRFASFEPLLGMIDARQALGLALYESSEIGLPFLNWVIAGGESGPGARPMHPDWARSLRDQCVAARVPFFFKQWGAWSPACAQYPQTEAEHDENENASCYGDIAFDPTGYVWPENMQPNHPRTWLMNNVGKKEAGRLLDGRTWDQYPQQEKQ